MIQPGDDVTWSKRAKRGYCITYTKFTGRVLSIEGNVGVVQRRGNNHRVRVHVSRLTKKEDDTPNSLVDRAKRELGI